MTNKTNQKENERTTLLFLKMVGDNSNKTVFAVATKLNKSPSYAYGLLKGLESCGYVQQVASGRRRLWDITDDGRAFLDFKDVVPEA